MNLSCGIKRDHEFCSQVNVTAWACYPYVHLYLIVEYYVVILFHCWRLNWEFPPLAPFASHRFQNVFAVITLCLISKMGGAYRTYGVEHKLHWVFLGTPVEKKTPFEKIRWRWEDSNEMHIKKRGDGVWNWFFRLRIWKCPFSRR